MFPNLSTLNLGWTNVTDLPNLTSLAHLDMSNCTIHSLFEGEGLKSSMEKLILSGAAVNDSKALQCVETSRLCLLDLSNSSLQSFSFLLNMNALTDLNVSDSAVVDNSVEHIAYVGANLRFLNLSNTGVSSDGIAALAGKVPYLETLLLSGTSINDTAIAYISMLPSLKVLNLSSTNVKGVIHQEGSVPDEVPSFNALQNLSHLERLDLEGIHLSDIALSPLINLVRLSHLSLQSVSLTDASLHHVSSAPDLIHLGVRDAVLTDSGLSGFVLPPRLEVLDLSGCWLLTKDALMHFCHKHPQVEMRHELVGALERRNIQYSQLTRRIPQCKHKQGNHFI